MEKLFSLNKISKSFGKVQVLENVDIEILKGEVHALMGENGAGKSTLMNVLSGVISKDSGDIMFEGKKIDQMTPELSKKLGIGFVHQELNLAESITVAENIFMGRLPYKNKLIGVIDFKKLNEDTNRILSQLGANFKAWDIVGNLSTANKQLVEIARALSLKAKVIIFDEPTTSLSDQDVKNLFNIIMKLKYSNISSIYISHRMKEIYEICDRITILRDGKCISTDRVKELSEEQIIQKLVGRSLDNLYPKENVEIGEKHLEVKDLCDNKGLVKNNSFFCRKGEIVGFAGLVGSGRTELVRLIFGADHKKSGEILIDGKKVRITCPTDAIKHGISLLTEDRKNQGLALSLSIKDNITLTSLNKLYLEQKKNVEIANKFINTLNIKIEDMDKPVSSLSGGNQQKVVLAKWLNANSSIYIFDEPTKGIDIGAKSEIYSIVNNLAKEGKSLLVVSSEISELLGLCDRIYVLNNGRIAGEISREEATQEKIMEFATREEI